MTTTEAQRLKEQGQLASLWSLPEVVRLNFEAIIRTAPARFSINDIREACDRMLIPESARGGLFNAAVRAGLIRPLLVQGATPAGCPARASRLTPRPWSCTSG